MPPLSVQALLAQQSQSGDPRPKFVSKKEREAHRAAEKEAVDRAEADRLAQLKRARAAWEQSGPSSEPTPAPASDPELRRIKQQYLGTREDRDPRRPKRARDASKKFHFEWDADDDTSDPSLVAAPAAALLHGRAGLDGSERAGTGKSKMKSTLDEKPWSEKRLGEMKARDWRIFREDFQIQARGGDLPHPLRSWRESTIPVPVLEAIEAMGYREPTPIQRQAIPIGLEPRDLIGIAETGSGKTASFVVPMLAHVQRQPRLTEDTQHLGPYALILAPTRELAQQIETETRKFASRLGFRVVSLVGGRDLNEQAFYLNDGAEIVIATPGRLQDCLERHILVLGQCHFLVMDEADRMVDMNYEEALHYILASLPSAEEGHRITMLYSATMPPSVESIARTYLRRPATVIIGQAGQAVGTVEQRVEFVDDEAHRQRRLLEVLDSGFAAPMIVFVNQKVNADLVGKDLRRAGWHVAILHSGLSQPQREAAIASLREGRNEVLCCTDIGARGIDLPDVSLVVNYQFPTQFPSYIHRIGRTGRAGKQGCAVSLVDDNDAEHFYELRLALSKSPVSTVPAALAQHPAALQRPAP